MGSGITNHSECSSTDYSKSVVSAHSRTTVKTRLCPLCGEFRPGPRAPESEYGGKPIMNFVSCREDGHLSAVSEVPSGLRGEDEAARIGCDDGPVQLLG